MLLIGNALAIPLAAGAVQCVVTSPLYTYAVEMVADVAQALHFGAMFGRSGLRPDAPAFASYALFLTGVLDGSQGKAVVGLAVLDAEERAYGEQEGAGLQVGHLPTLERLALLGRGFGNEAVSTERRVEQVHGLRFNLLDADTLRVGRLGAVSNDAHRVRVSLDADRSVGVDDSSAVGTGGLVHA